MSLHQKRLTSPHSWRIAKKENVFITKTAPGPHNKTAMPMSVWLRDHMGLVLNMKEAKKVLTDGSVLLNGKPCRDPKMGVGVFDIVAIPKMDRYFRILRNKKGDYVSIAISEEDAQTRLCKIADKTLVKGGKVQYNLRYGANIIDEGDYKPRDSIVVSLIPENRFAVVDHFPFVVGNTAMIIGGKHSGKIAKITEMVTVPGSVPNRVELEDIATGEAFETIEAYVFMVGRETPAVADWGI